MVVVTVMNLFEMNNLESKAYTVIKKLRIKKRMKFTAAGIIGKMSKIHLDLKKGNDVQIKEVFKLNNMMNKFRTDHR